MNLDKLSIVDVRSPDEYAEQHFPGAINIPLEEIHGRISEVKKLKKPVVTYCRSGIRSGMAVTVLKQHGIDDVINGGGLQDLLHAKINYTG
jgi:phage shock protein E